MKKGTKVVLITAVVMILTGGIMSTICLILGANWSDTGLHGHWGRRGSANYEEGRLDVVEEQAYAGEVTQVMEGTAVARDEDDLNTAHFEESDGREHTDGDVRWWSFVDGIDSLDLSVDAGEMFVVQEGSEFRVEVEHPRDNFRCEVKDGTLIVDEDGRNMTWNFFEGEHPIIWVTIPEDGTFEKVKCDVGAGSMTVDDRLMADTVEIDVDAGSFTAVWVGAEKKMSLDVDAGSAEIYGGVCNGKLSVDVDAGSAYLDSFEGKTANFDVDAGAADFGGTLDGDWKADCDVGGITLRLSAAEKDYNYQVENDLGSVEIGGMSFSSMSDHSRVENGASRTASIDCDMGSVEVSFE